MGAIFYFRKLEGYYFWLHRRATRSTQIAIISSYIVFHVNCTCHREFPVPLFTGKFNLMVLVRKSGSDKGESARYHYRRVFHGPFKEPMQIYCFHVQNLLEIADWLKKLRCLLTFCDVLRSYQGFCWSLFKACAKQNGSKTISAHFNEKVLCVTINFPQKKIKLVLCR